MVSNEEFERELSVPANQRVMLWAAGKFAGTLTEDERRECCLLGLYKTIRLHDPTKNKSFTSNLATWVRRACLDAVGARRRRGVPTAPLRDVPEPAGYREEDFEYLLHKIEQLPFEWQNRVIRQYYLDGKSYREIGLENGYTAKTAYMKVRKAMARLKKNYL